MKKIILTIGLFLALGASAQEVVKTTANKFNGYGIVYSLPRTDIDIKVTATRSVEKPGPFYKYAQKYLGTAPTVTKEATVWKIKGIKASAKGTPDPDKQYAIQLKAGDTSAFYLTPDGILSSINATPCCDAPKKDKKKSAQKAQKTQYTDADFAQLYTEEMMLMGSTAKMAEAAAKQIYSIREYRLDLLTGNADVIPSEKSFEILLDEMAKREALLTALFMGTIESKTVVKHIIYTPDVSPEKTTTNAVAFRFSERAGVVDAKDLSGEPIYIALNVTETGNAPTDSKGEAISPAKGSLIYTIPGYADVKITFKGQELFSHNIPLAQLGVDYGLLLSGKEVVKARFCPQTGALLNLSTELPTK